MFLSLLSLLLGLFALILIAQSVFNIYSTLYVWDKPDRIEAAKAPTKFKYRPKLKISVLLPCRHEEAVIGETIRKLSKAKYPKTKLEFLVICTPDDPKTIAAVKKSIKENKIRNAKLIVFELPAGKSRGMNIGLTQAKGDLITIFDSEDDVSPDIFSIANTLFAERDIDVLQCGVQLMDYNSHWYSAHNVLEYFFWFKSRMHFHAAMDIVPLGGNTVFFRKSDLEEVGGWDEAGLTEDADIGIRLSLAGKKFGVMYDAAHVTREETPHNARAFVKQRTRWDQGFLQILAKEDWTQLPTFRQRALILYVLMAPVFMGFVIALSPVLVALGLLFKLSVMVSLLTFLPLFLSLLSILVSLVGLYEFGQDQKIKIKWRSYPWLVVTFMPYQLLLTIAAVRSYLRFRAGNHGWEKTVHLGAHRTEPVEQPTPLMIPAPGLQMSGEEAES